MASSLRRAIQDTYIHTHLYIYTHMNTTYLYSYMYAYKYTQPYYTEIYMYTHMFFTAITLLYVDVEQAITWTGERDHGVAVTSSLDWLVSF